VLTTLQAVIHDDPRPLTCPEELAEIVSKCLSKKAADRFQSMVALDRALAAAAAKPSLEPPSIAVLPFVNLSGADSDESFCDGLPEDIINALGRVSGLKVAARTSAFSLREEHDIRKVADDLGVVHVLEGAIQRTGDRIRVTAQLVRGRDGLNVWTERYDRNASDVFELQDELSGAIVRALHITLVPQDADTVPPGRTSNLEAYRLYLEGRHFFEQMTPAAAARSRECFERATQLDPDYALPHVGLAEYYHYRALFLNERPHSLMPAALAEAETALRLNHESAEAYAIRGAVRARYQYDWIAAGEDFARAIELNPALAMAHYRRATWYLRPLGRLEEARAEMKVASELDPLNPLIRVSDALTVYLLGQKQEAVRYFTWLNELFPSLWLTSLITCFVLFWEGMLEEARAIAVKGLALDPANAFLKACLALLSAKQGNKSEAERILEELEAIAATRYLSPTALYIACFACGKVERAFEWLEKAIEERDSLVLMIVNRWRLAGVDTERQHRALLRKMNLG
jgi:serine/threonine-protein kinase